MIVEHQAFVDLRLSTMSIPASLKEAINADNLDKTKQV
jgi:hypothetical protein